MTSGRTWLELIRDRTRKEGLYDSPGYWDMKATAYSGLARSNWPSNAYNREVHRRQMAVLDRLLGDVRGQRIADVGCGTGRASHHLARRGASVVGWDFSPKAVEAAAAEAEAEGLSAEFRVGNVREPFPAALRGAFDAVVVIGCLTLACRDEAELDTALEHIAALPAPGAPLLLIEPLHESRLLRRILRLSVDGLVARAARFGLELRHREGLFFFPARYALAFRELPDSLVRPAVEVGERLLGVSPRLERLSDYKVVAFERR